MALSETLFLFWIILTFSVFLTTIWISKAPARAPSESLGRRLISSLAGALGLELVMFYLTYGGLSALPYTRYPWFQILNWLLVFAWTLFALIAYTVSTRNKARAIPLLASVIAAGSVFLASFLPLVVVRNFMRITIVVSLLWWVVGWKSQDKPNQRQG